jgi:hypothetical protein
VRWCTGAGGERRLIGLHGLHSATNAIVNVALLGTVVMAVDEATRSGKLLGYLVFTLAPFALAAPLIGWAVPRSGMPSQRLVAVSFLGRAILAALLVVLADTVVAYGLLFGILVGQRVHTVALYSAVPDVLGRGTARLHANARLNRAAAMSGAIGGGIGAVVVALVAPAAALVVAAGCYLVGARGSRGTWPLAAGETAASLDDPLPSGGAAPATPSPRVPGLRVVGRAGAPRARATRCGARVRRDQGGRRGARSAGGPVGGRVLHVGVDGRSDGRRPRRRRGASAPSSGRTCSFGRQPAAPGCSSASSSPRWPVGAAVMPAPGGGHGGVHHRPPRQPRPPAPRRRHPTAGRSERPPGVRAMGRPGAGDVGRCRHHGHGSRSRSRRTMALVAAMGLLTAAAALLPADGSGMAARAARRGRVRAGRHQVLAQVPAVLGTAR